MIVWRHLLNLALSRSSLPLLCSPCAGEMGWDLGMDWVIFPPSWVEGSTSQTLFLIWFLIHMHTAKPWSLQSLHAQDCQKSLLQFSLEGGLFSKPARSKAVSSFVSVFSSNAWAPAQVLQWLSSPEGLSRAQLSLAGCFWLFPSPYNTWYEWATMPSTCSAVTALGVLTQWPSNWKTTPPKPPPPAGAPTATV